MEKFICDFCEKSFKSKLAIQGHMDRFHLNHDNPNAEKCIACERFILKEKFKEHFKKYHKKLKCEKCPKTFYTKIAFWQHKKSHEEECTCNHCNKIFSSNRHLHQHIQEVHFGNKDLSKCEQCGILITSRGLKHHVKTIHDKKLDHKCNTCGKCFSNATHLKDHIALALEHLNLKKYVCSVCEKYFKTKGILKRHLIGVHGVKPKTKCGECGRTFTMTNSYTRHLKAHKIRPFFCSYEPCKNMFKTDKELKKHISRSHKNPLPHHRLIKHNCDQCDKSYKSKQGLKIHLANVHLGLKYECHHCEKKFLEKQGIKNHLLKHHFEK